LAAGSDWSVVPTINSGTGEIAISLSSTTPITSTLGGSLVTIDFHALGTQTGSVPVELVVSVNPSGQQVISTELEDAQGTFTLTPVPTNGFDPRIDGFVMFPANPGSVVGTEAISALVESGNPIGVVDTLSAIDSVRSPSEETTNSPALVPESSEQPLTAGQGTLIDTTQQVASAAIGHGTTTVATAISQLVSSGLGTLAAPIAGLTFQFGNGSPLGEPRTGFTVVQQPVDQVFQTLGRRTINSTLLTTLKDVLDRIVTGHIRLSPTAAYNQDSQWDDLTSDQEWQGFVMARHRARCDVTADTAPPPTMVQHVVADLDALDWYFARTADDADQGTDGE
jgi:hypothetical protein